jgi:hypothetical protein
VTTVLRRISSPTKYAGLSLKAWTTLIGVGGSIAVLITVLKTPLAPTLVVLSWGVLTPGAILLMWAHQQGVSVPVLLGDFVRYGARRRRRVLVHEPAEVLRGGIVLSGPLPTAAPDTHDQTDWLSDAPLTAELS